jgi:uncharacterized membrane protein YedE/YeeE
VAGGTLGSLPARHLPKCQLVYRFQPNAIPQFLNLVKDGAMPLTYLHSLMGGALIGLASALLLLLDGRVAGVSSIIGGALQPTGGNVLRNLAFLCGLFAGPLLYRLGVGGWPVVHFQSSLWVLALAGLLVGFGARLGSGCTSGHGVCGLARLSRRSIVAVVTFSYRGDDHGCRGEPHGRDGAMIKEFARIFVSLAAGVIFGFGLSLSGMLDPARVRGFLDIAGRFDPSLAFVLAGAVTVASAGTLISRRLRHPLLDSMFHLPASEQIDSPLIAGAAIFGIGWGLSGLCPGPAIASLALGLVPSYVFAATMLLGTFIHDNWPQRCRLAANPNRDADVKA